MESERVVLFVVMLLVMAGCCALWVRSAPVEAAVNQPENPLRAAQARLSGYPGSQKLQLVIEVSRAAQVRVVGRLSGRTPDLTGLLEPSPVELAQYASPSPERTWLWTGNVDPGLNLVEPGWSLAGLSAGKYDIELDVRTLEDGDGLTFSQTMDIGGIELRVSGSPVVLANRPHTLTGEVINRFDDTIEAGKLVFTNVPHQSGARSLPAVSAQLGELLLDEPLLPEGSQDFSFTNPASAPGPNSIQIDLIDSQGNLLGRSYYHYFGITASEVPSAIRETDSSIPLDHWPVADWAYAATISKIYIPSNPLVLPQVVAETVHHGVSVFSWETHSPSAYLQIPYFLKQAEAQGLRTLAYTGAVGLEGQSFLTRYPDTADWVLQRRDGSLDRQWNAYPFAPASPYFPRYRSAFFRYLAGNLDGVFADISNLYSGTDYSPYSREEFAAAHPGLAIDPYQLAPTDPDYWRWNEWRYDTVARLAREVRNTLKAENPDTVLSWNMAETIGRIAWAHGYAIDPVRLGKVIDVPLVECNYTEAEPLWILGLNARYYSGAAPGKPVWVALQFKYPDGASFTPPQTQLTMAEIYANGASAYIDWQPVSETLNPDHQWVQAAGEFFNFVRSHRELFADAATTSAARVGLFFSQKTNDYWQNPEGAVTNVRYQTEVMGWYQLLLEAGIQVDVLNYESLLAADLRGRYDAIVLPGAAALSDAELRALYSYLQAGGTLLSSGDTGKADQYGRTRPVESFADALGIEDTAAYRLFHLSGPWGRVYWNTGDPEARQTMWNAVKQAGLPEFQTVRVQLSSDGQAPQIEVVTYTKDNTTLVHLVNWETNVGDWRAITYAFAQQERPYQPVTRVNPLPNLQVQFSLPAGVRPASVRLASLGKADQQLPFTIEADGQVQVVLPELGVYAILVIDWEGGN